MKNSWLVYVAVAAISALAGVAIAGPPNMVGTDATIVVPETTTTTTSAPDTVVEASTTTTEAAASSTSTTSTTSTTTAPDRATTTTTSEPAADIDRSVVAVAAINGAAAGGLASRVRDELRDLGFTQARSGDGDEVVDATVIYFFEGFAAEAVEVAEALGLKIADVKPIEDAPSYSDADDDQVIVYIGRDRA